MNFRVFTGAAAASAVIFVACVAAWVFGASVGWQHVFFQPEAGRAIEVGLAKDHAWITRCAWSGPPPLGGRVHIYPASGSRHVELLGAWYDAGTASTVSPDGGTRASGPHRNYGLAYWMPTLAAGLLPAVWALRVLRPRARSRRRARQGLCPACGYDRRATPGRCPECGAPPPPPQPPPPTTAPEVTST